MKNKNLKFLESFSFCFANRGYAPRCAWAKPIFLPGLLRTAEGGGQSPFFLQSKKKTRCGTHFLLCKKSKKKRCKKGVKWVYELLNFPADL
jgi:hypothetical protein